MRKHICHWVNESKNSREDVQNGDEMMDKTGEALQRCLGELQNCKILRNLGWSSQTAQSFLTGAWNGFKTEITADRIPKEN
jgi:hypothetical protein